MPYKLRLRDASRGGIHRAIPHALEHAPSSTILPIVLAGLVVFFVLEKLVIWHHCHQEGCEVRESAGALLLIGDAMHNFVDGVIIAATFTISIPLGISASLAVIAHEVPQEVGDFAILLESRYKKDRAFLYNTISGATTVPGAIMAYLYLKEVQTATPFILAFSATSFIYIAMVDLIPKLHRRTSIIEGIRQLVLMLAGIGTILALHLK